MPITVPIVSKKSESMMEKMTTTAVTTPTRAKTDRSRPAPRLEKSGHATSAAGQTACPGVGNVRPPVAPLTATATTVLARMPTRSAPLDPRVVSHRVSRSPNRATATGADDRSPRVTGTPGGPGFTMPADTRPMKRMKRPMPTPMARLSAAGIAFMIASRKPVSTSAVITRPSSSTTPIAAVHGSFMPATSWKATTALSPIPDARASG